MASRHRHILLVVLGLATSAAAETPIPSPAPTGQTHDEAVCTTRADETGLADAHRETFLRECVAGERLDRPKPDPAKP